MPIRRLDAAAMIMDNTPAILRTVRVCLCLSLTTGCPSTRKSWSYPWLRLEELGLRQTGQQQEPARQEALEAGSRLGRWADPIRPILTVSGEVYFTHACTFRQFGRYCLSASPAWGLSRRR
jgi:hypothetical protein